MQASDQHHGEDGDTRARILDCAEARFRGYGYRKTTMAEIAGDADMSAANIYRFFANKEDLAAACASRCMRERNANLRDTVRDVRGGAQERLRIFTLTMLQLTHETAYDQPHINELVEIVTNHHGEVVHEKTEAMIAMLAEILAYGNETGEFAVDDIIATARTVYGALVLFNVPIFMSLYPLNEFERMAGDAVNLLVRGLRP